MPLLWGCLLVFASFAVAAFPAGQPPPGAAQQPLDVIYVPTPTAVVAQMLSMARVGLGDVVHDLGSGDGRIVISAVRDFGAARAVGFEIDPQRIKEATENARAAGVADRVRFITQDLFAADLSEATVVTLYLLPKLNERLRPKPRALKPGTRIVSHNYAMGDEWKPSRTVVAAGSLVHFWTVPRR